jgi:hypothetical protein
MTKSHLALVAPTTVNGTVDKAGPPKRRRNAEVRAREYLMDAEVNRLISAAAENRNGHRDRARTPFTGGHAIHAINGCPMAGAARRSGASWHPPCRVLKLMHGDQ